MQIVRGGATVAKRLVLAPPLSYLVHDLDFGIRVNRMACKGAVADTVNTS